MVNWPGKQWLPVAELAEPTCFNLGSPQYPRWAMRLPEDALDAWRDLNALCREIDWTAKYPKKPCSLTPGGDDE